jgi:hypothetical protein
VLFELADKFGEVENDQILQRASTRYANIFIECLTERNEKYFEHAILPVGLFDPTICPTYKCYRCSRKIPRHYFPESSDMDVYSVEKHKCPVCQDIDRKRAGVNPWKY